MAHTFFSPIAQETVAYDEGYRSGFDQVRNGNQYTPVLGSRWTAYESGRKHGIDDFFAIAKITGVK
jgi:hypothetical protein